MTASTQTTIGLVDFATRLIDLALLPPLTDAQAVYLAALDGTRPPLSRWQREDAARAGGRRYLQTLIAAHQLVAGETVRIAAGAGESARRIREDVLTLVSAYLAATGDDRPDVDRDALTVRLTVVSTPTPKGPRP